MHHRLTAHGWSALAGLSALGFLQIVRLWCGAGPPVNAAALAVSAVLGPSGPFLLLALQLIFTA